MLASSAGTHTNKFTHKMSVVPMTQSRMKVLNFCIQTTQSSFDCRSPAHFVCRFRLCLSTFYFLIQMESVCATDCLMRPFQQLNLILSFVKVSLPPWLWSAPITHVDSTLTFAIFFLQPLLCVIVPELFDFSALWTLNWIVLYFTHVHMHMCVCVCIKLNARILLGFKLLRFVLFSSFINFCLFWSFWTFLPIFALFFTLGLIFLIFLSLRMFQSRKQEHGKQVECVLIAFATKILSNASWRLFYFHCSYRKRRAEHHRTRNHFRSCVHNELIQCV